MPNNQNVETLPKLTYNVGEAARALGVSKSAIYHKVADGQLPSRRVFGRVVITAEDLQRVVADAKVRPVPLSGYAASASGSGPSALATETHSDAQKSPQSAISGRRRSSNAERS
jgi:excisionase family DNA binding protein